MYDITIGRLYVAVGLLLVENKLTVLIREDWGGPSFVPAGLFDLGTFEVPSGWMFGLLPGIRASGRDLWIKPSQAAWGYRELVLDENHGSDLDEGVPDALEIFDRRIAEAETMLSWRTD